METVFENNFLTIRYDERRRIVFYEWKTATASLSEEGFLSECRNILKIVLEKRARFIIGDTRELRFTISPEAQKVINKEMLEQIGDFVLKFAHIESADDRVRETIEQMYEATEEELFQNRYFENQESAFNWISDSIK